MKETDINALHDDLLAVVEKWRLKNAAFCCQDDEGNFIGLKGIGKMSVSGIFDTSLNIGRLWQSMRESVRDILDDFERQER